MGKVSVFLAEWQVLFREGIHFTLCGEEDIEVIGEAADNEEALDFIEVNLPSIAILNAGQGKPSGIDVTNRIKRNYPLVSVILIMDREDEEQLFSAMRCGASACVTKDIDPDDLVNTVRKVARGAYPISEALLRPGIAYCVVDEFEAFSLINKGAGNLLASLSPCEGWILRSVADGSSSEQVSQALGISGEVIRHHLDLILAKLVANDHNRVVIEAAQNHLPSRISEAS
ncbi:response regulator [Chloroflexota bacterium]